MHLEDTEQAPVRMADALERGRVLVDREGRWQLLQLEPSSWQSRASQAEIPLEDAMPELGL